MKIKKQGISTKKKIITTVLSLLVLAGIVAGLFFYNKQNSPSTSKTSMSGLNKVKTESISTNPKDKQVPPNTDTPQPPQEDDSTNKSVVQMSVSASINGNTVYIRGGINNASVSSGTCYAQLSSGSGDSVRKDTTLLQNPSTTDCKTIAINTSDLAKGTWTVTLHYSSDTMEGVSNEASFEIQ